MSQLIRLVYASRSSYGSGQTRQGLDPGVARILAKSRKNNARRQIVGGLLFGEGYFLQCLEGEADAVMALYRTIAADKRHGDVKVLSNASITTRSFGTWSMKYVPGEQRLKALLQSWGLTQFDPYALSTSQIETAVSFMQSEADEYDTQPGVLDALAPALGRGVRKEARPPELRSNAKALHRLPDEALSTAPARTTRPLFWVLLAMLCLAGVTAAVLMSR